MRKSVAYIGPACRPGKIAPRLGLSVRTVERWLAVGGEPEHRRPETPSATIEPFRQYLEKRWQGGQHNGAQLWEEIKRMGFRGGRATVYRWAANRKEQPNSTPEPARRRAPSRRECAWFLSQRAASRSTNVPVVTFVIFMNMRQSLK
ncbi:hypothetical protein ACOJBO_03120 [Rhizobium beringeri]